MSIDLQISHSGGAFTSISDYLASSDKIPYVLRNRDFTPSVEPVNMSLSITCPITPSRGDGFKVLVDSTLVFAGYAKSVLLNYDDRTFDLEIVNDLLKLDEHLVEYSELHSALTVNYGDWMKYSTFANTTYGGLNTQYNSANVGLMHLLKNMFSIAGLSLDTSLLDEAVLISGWTYWSGGGYDVPTTGNVLYKHLFVWEEEMYCINQQVATYHTNLDVSTGSVGSDGYQGKKISFWDYVREICSNLSLYLKIAGVNQFTLTKATDNYTVIDDRKYEYSNPSTDAQNVNLSMVRYYGIPENYQTDTVTELGSAQAAWDGKGSTIVKTYNNHLIHFYDYYSGAYRPYAPNDLACFVVTGGSWDRGDNNINMIQNRVNELTKAYSQGIITTDLTTTFKTVRSHKIDIARRRSEIIQEVII